MANELQYQGTSGETIYAIVRDVQARVWDGVGQQFVTYSSANFSRYPISLTEQGTSGFFVGNFPASAPTGQYTATYSLRVGASPAETDPELITISYLWSNTSPPTAPNDLPITVEFARQQCRIPDESEDYNLEGLIRAAMQYVEASARIKMLPQRLQMALGNFPAQDNFIVLEYGPVRGNVVVEYVESRAATPTTFTTLADFQTWLDDNPPRLAPTPGLPWPSTYNLAIPAVKISYDVGYSSVAAIPESLKRAVVMIVVATYNSPDGFIRGGGLQIPPIVEQFIGPHSLRGYP